MTKVEYDQRRQIKRGDIYYVEIPYHTGHEIYKDRPGIVVSAPDVQRNNLVWVVFCSASRVADSAEHVTIRTTPEVSTALVEQLYAVDLSRVGKFLGTCTDREMQMVDLALQRILGFNTYEYAQQKDQEREYELARVQAERDVFKRLYQELLGAQ